MREVLFRGKGTCDCGLNAGNWIYGYYVNDFWKRNDCGIIPSDYEKGGYCEVCPETVGQYTGLTDKNGTKIFEGDILVFCKGATYPYKIEWDGMGWKLYRSDGKRIKEAFECNEIHYVNISEVIGNIHDNPELLKGGAE